ncbi:MAG: ankyrin repeat domain-containing protein [Bryobacteraceae bacterium]|jgi:ankyrin repeat protein
MSAAQPVAKSEQQLFEAIRAGDASRVSELLEAAPSLAGARAPDGASPVLMAIYCGHPEMVGLFEERGVALNLFEACAVGRRERVAALVDANPSLIREFSDDGYPVLGLAVFFGHDEIAGMLIESGADVNAASRNSQHVAPLHAAAARHNTRMVGDLLARGADPDVEQGGGITPLHEAAFHDDREIAELLLAYGADPRHKTADGKTAADLATGRGHGELAAQLARLAA